MARDLDGARIPVAATRWARGAGRFTAGPRDVLVIATFAYDRAMSRLGPLKIDERKSVHLADIDPDDTSLAPGGKEETRVASEALCAKLGDLQELLFAGHHHKLLVVLQGMDTSGKDGTVRHVMSGVSPQSVRVTSFKKPTDQEAGHDYLWRGHAAAPGTGEIAIFNRSHYEEVLIVRVHQLVPEKAWK